MPEDPVLSVPKKPSPGGDVPPTPASPTPVQSKPAPVAVMPDIGCFIRNVRGAMRVAYDPSCAAVFEPLGWKDVEGTVDGFWCADGATIESVKGVIGRLDAHGLVRISNKTLDLATCLALGFTFADADGHSYYLRKDS